MGPFCLPGTTDYFKKLLAQGGNGAEVEMVWLTLQLGRKSTFGKADKIDTNTHRAPIPSPPSELSLAVRLGIVAHAHNPTWVEHYEGHKSQANMDQAPPK